MIVTNGKIYCQCKDCGKLVRLNKAFFGSLHICVDQTLPKNNHVNPRDVPMLGSPILPNYQRNPHDKSY